jgi:hypothetical protein
MPYLDNSCAHQAIAVLLPKGGFAIMATETREMRFKQ